MVIRERTPKSSVKCNHEPIVDKGFPYDYTFCKHCHKEWTNEIEREYKISRLGRRDNHR